MSPKQTSGQVRVTPLVIAVKSGQSLVPEISMQKVGAMSGAVKPGLDHAFRGGKIHGEIFTKDFIGPIPGVGNAIPDIVSVRINVGEIIPVNHILGFFS